MTASQAEGSAYAWPSPMHPRLSFALPVLATLGVVLVFGVALFLSAEDLEALRWLAAVPRERLDAPVPGPAVYRGELFGPPDRTSGSGQPAAASWWWVTTSDGEDTTVHCFERARDELSLRADGRTVPLDFFGTEVDDVALIADDRWDEGHAVIDLGPLQPAEPKALLGRAASCLREDATVHERWIPPGASVDVVACYRDGILRACAGSPLRGIVAVGSEAAHRRRRAGEIHDRFRIAGLVVAAGLLTLTLLLGTAAAPSGEREEVR